MPTPMEVTVGQVYKVPCIKDASGLFVPIIGPAHEDGLEICVTPAPLHYHYDYRFIPESFGLKPPCAARVLNDSEINEHWKECLRVDCDNGSLLFAQLRLMERFAEHRLCSLACPHKGIPLVGSGDIRKCGGHGLTWNVATGRLHFKPPYFFRLKGTDKVIPATTLGDFKIILAPGKEITDVRVELLDSESRVISEFKVPCLYLSATDTLNLTINCTKSNQ